MEFGNPIVGQEDLIRSAIKSPDFDPDSETGVTGWRIARDGSATFNNLTIGSTNFTIDDNGNAVFNDITANGEIFLGGTSLADALDLLPKGVIAVSTISSGTPTANIGTTETMCFLASMGAVSTQRIYWFALKGHMGFSAAGVAVDLRMRFTTDGSTPNTTSTLLRTVRHSSANTSLDFDQVKYFIPPVDTTTLRIGISLQVANAGTCFIYQSATDRDLELALNDGGSLLGTASGQLQQISGTTTGGGTTQYVSTYACNNSASFQGNGNNRSIAECYQGQYSGTNGNQFSCITFPYATIQTDLAGATIVKTEVYLNNNHFFANAGGDAIIGTHTFATVAGNANYASVTPDITRVHFDLGQAKWVTVSNTIGNALRDNTAKGIALGKGPSTSQIYYGYFAGDGQSGEPQLRVTYTK